MYRKNVKNQRLTPFLGGLLLLVAQVAGGAVEGPWLPVGETVSYKIYWGIIPVALSTATTEWVEYEGEQRIAIRFQTKSNSVIEKVYPVDDFIESIVDPETLLPLRFIKRLSEGRYRTDETTVFDRENNMAYFTKVKKDGSIRKKEYPITDDTRDLVSFMYFMRSQPIAVGDERELEVMADEKLYDLFLRIPKKQSVKLEKFGKVDTLRVEPKAKFEGLFVRKGEMTLWITPGEHKYLAKMAVKVPVASVNVLLYKVEGTGSEDWILPPKKKKTHRKRRF